MRMRVRMRMRVIVRVRLRGEGKGEGEGEGEGNIREDSFIIELVAKLVHCGTVAHVSQDVVLCTLEEMIRNCNRVHTLRLGSVNSHVNSE